MEKIWHPQRNESDATAALLKNFIHYLNYGISKTTIEKDTREHPDFPINISLATIMQLLEKWGINHKAFRCGIDDLRNIASPSILYISEQSSVKTGSFVMFYGIKENTIQYLDTRKGWILEDITGFSEKFNKAALSAISIEQQEENFELKEKEYEEKKLSNPELKNVRVIDEFLTDEECEYIINLANPLFQRSMFMYGDKKILDDRRTSFSAELHIFPTDEILNVIRKRASELMQIPEDHFEYFQCVSYDKSQEIDHHFDTFDENSDGGRKIISAGGQRKYTMLAYLNDDFEGGGTYFPNLDFLVKPKKRRVLIFNNLDENGKVMKSSWHGGLPVSKGRKYAINMWVRNKPCR